MLQEIISNQVDSNISLVRPGPILWKRIAGAVLEVFANVDRPHIHAIYGQRTGCHHCKFSSVVIPLFSWYQGLSPHPGSPHLMRLPSVMTETKQDSAVFHVFPTVEVVALAFRNGN